MKAAYCTLGCKVNQYDTQAMRELMENAGYDTVDFEDEADVYIVNTCTVTAVADKKNRAVIRRCRRDNPDAVIGVCGCYSQHAPEAVRALGVDIIGGSGGRREFVELMLSAMEGKIRAEQLDNALRRREFEVLPAGGLEERTRAMLKVQDGCVNFCSYCIVPYVRGRERSRRADDIVREADELVKSGVKEIMLIGQNVNSYGLDSDEGVSFAQLLHRVSQTGIERIRFMTSHPKDLSDALIDEMAHNPAIAPHLHLPVQAGSNRILQAMNRRYTREQYLEKVKKLRAAIPHIGLTTDLIVAFPGETEAEFEDTLSLVEQVRYDSAYTFIYSPRKGTRAAEMPGRIASGVASERIERLIALQEKITGEVLASMRGETVQALVEGVSRRRENQLTGKTGRNINVNFNGAPDDIGKMVRVRITGAGSNTLRGEKVEE